MGYAPPEQDWLGDFVKFADNLDIESWFDLLHSMPIEALDDYVGRLNKKRYKLRQCSRNWFIERTIPLPPPGGSAIWYPSGHQAKALFALMDKAEQQLAPQPPSIEIVKG